MKLLPKLALLTVLSLASVAGSLRAGTFNFSYTANSDTVNSNGNFHGTLTGTQVGDSLTGYITGVSVTSLFVNNTQVSGTIFNSSFNGLAGGPSGSAVVSFSLNQNSFLFVNGDPGNNYSGYTGFMWLVDGTLSGIYNGGMIAYGRIAEVNEVTILGSGSWSLTNASSSVPDSGATLALLGLTLGSLAIVRRKFGRN